jgi:hypothetical protein
MAHRYVYNKPHRHHPRAVFRRRLLLVIFVLALIGLAVFGLTYDLQNEEPQAVKSSVTKSEIKESTQTFKSPYFQFSDYGNWVYSKTDSSEKEFVYYKYRGLIIEHRLTIHVDQTPIALYLATTRVLPVRMVNHNRLEPVTVAGPCVGSYAKDELHNVKPVTIEGATMLCDPESPLYTVVLSEIDGDYNLKFRKSNGLPIQLVVTYQDMRLDHGPETINQIAKTLQIL